MFESMGEVVTAADLKGLLPALTRLDRHVTDAQRIDQLSVLEQLKAALAGAQAQVTVDFVESQEQVATAWQDRARELAGEGDFEGWQAAREQARRATVTDDTGDTGDSDDTGETGHTGKSEATGGSRRRRRPGAGVGVAGQVALARRVSPSRGARQVSTAVALVRDLPRTFAALQAGTLSEWRAELVARETGVLAPALRRVVDAELHDSLGGDLGSVGDRELVRRVRAIGYRVDAASVLARTSGAKNDRRVTIRPAPDTMSYLTAYLPVTEGVAVHAALAQAAAAAKAAGDERSTGQLMADTLVTRVTGQQSADAVPVEVQIVITDRSLLAGDDTPAQVPGYGTVPAGWARDLLTRSTQQNTPLWLRRLYTHPKDGTLAAMDSTRRVFDGRLRHYLLTRDAGTCRTPWCDAPARHLDHIDDHARGGPTNAVNGQSLCVRCNHTKQLPGWRAHVIPADPHTVITTTPTGHAYTSHAPPILPGQPPDQHSPLERHLETLLAS